MTQLRNASLRASLPIDESTVLVRFGGGTTLTQVAQPGGTTRSVARQNQPICPMGTFLAAVAAGNVKTYQDARICGK